METLTTPELSVQLNALSVDQLDKLIPALSGRLYCFVDHRSVYEIAGITRADNELTFLFSDSILGIDQIQKNVSDLSFKVRDDMTQAISKIL